MTKEFCFILAFVLLFYVANWGVIYYVIDTKRPFTSEDITPEKLCAYCNVTAKAIEDFVNRGSQTIHPCMAEHVMNEAGDLRQLLSDQKVCYFFFNTYKEQLWKKINIPDVKFQPWLCHQTSFSCVDLSKSEYAKDEEKLKEDDKSREKTLQTLKTFSF